MTSTATFGQFAQSHRYSESVSSRPFTMVRRVTWGIDIRWLRFRPRRTEHLHYRSEGAKRDGEAARSRGLGGDESTNRVRSPRCGAGSEVATVRAHGQDPPIQADERQRHA